LASPADVGCAGFDGRARDLGVLVWYAVKMPAVFDEFMQRDAQSSPSRRKWNSCRFSHRSWTRRAPLVV
jgi:hypothetical protein